MSVQRCDCVDGRCGHEYADECVLPLRDYGSALEALNAELEAECKKLRRKMRERDEEHAAEIERWQGLYDMATGNDDAIAVLSAKLEAAETRAKEAEKNYRWMVERAADEKLDGYRELGARAAEAERQRDEALALLAEVSRALADGDTLLAAAIAERHTQECVLAAHPEPAAATGAVERDNAPACPRCGHSLQYHGAWYGECGVQGCDCPSYEPERAATDEEPGEGRS